MVKYEHRKNKMAQNRQSRDDLIKENTKLKESLLKESLKIKYVDACSGITIKIIPWFFTAIGFCFGVYELAAHVIPDIAGKKTTFKFSLSIYLSIALAGFSVLYAFFEHRLKKIEIKNLTEQLKKCREKLDPGIGTSGLAPDGSTNKEDEP